MANDFHMLILRILLLHLLLFTSSIGFSQQKLLLLNGNEINIKSYTIDDIYIGYKKVDDKRNKTKVVEKYEVFSITKQDGSEEIFFKPDSASFSLEEARNFIRGEQAAKQFYNRPANKWAAGAVGLSSSVLTFYSLPAPMLYAVVIGRFNPKKMQIPDGYDAPFSSTEEYRAGYNKKARHLKIQQSLKWGYIGLGIGLTAFIIYGATN